MSSNNFTSSFNDFKQKEASIGSRLSDFEIVKQLGKGSYGTVYVVRSKLDMNTYVMKKMELNHLKENQQKECYREVSILRKVSHPNIIKYYSSFLENESLCIIMEYAELGDLYTLIKHYKRHQKFFEEILLWRIAFEVLNGLEYLHSNNIIHRDIKCLNLFLSKDHHVKIGDLGVSTITSLGGMHCTRVGTPLYLSPELVKQVPYDYKTDIWSFGCSLYHLASLDPPFTGNNLIVLGNNIVKGRPKELPGFYSNELKNFIGKMLTKKPEKRPSAKDAKEMIPKNIMENIILANKNKEEIKARPFSSVGKRKNNDKDNNDNNSNINNINNNSKNNNATENTNINNNANLISNNNYINNNNNKSEDKIEKNKNNGNTNNINMNHNKDINQEEKKHKENITDKDNNNKMIKIKNEIKNEIKKEKMENNIISLQKEKIKIEEKNDIDNFDINEKNLNRQNSNLNIGLKNSSLYNALNIKKNFNCFRNKNAFKKSKEQKTFRNMFNANNKILKNNSIKVYSSMIQKEFSDLTKREKERETDLINKKEEKKNNLIKKEEDKKPNVITDTNIQLISINNNNIIINQINNNLFPSTIPNKIVSNTKIHKSVRKNSEIKNSAKDNILFPDLKLKKTSSTKDTTSNKEMNSKFIKNNISSENKIFSQKLVNQKRQRPFSSCAFKQNVNKNFSNDLHTNNNNNIKRLNINRPLTGFKPNFNSNNSNVMNININFYNIDMNKRFLAPEINPLNSNELENLKEKNEVIKRGGSKSNINLKDYQNNNEFIFQKLIKALQDINNDKKLTINDLH